MRIIETKVYFFDELSEESKKEAIRNMYDINLYEWYNYIINVDAKNICLDIIEFDLDKGTITTKIDDYHNTARSILAEHGEHCETYKLAELFLEVWDVLVRKHSDETGSVAYENEMKFDKEANELEQKFKYDLGREYLALLEKEYDYLTSEQAITEAILAGEYEFTEEGDLI